MKVILNAIRNIQIPNSRTAYISAFKNKQVTLFHRIFFDFFIGVVHFFKIIKFKVVPVNI